MSVSRFSRVSGSFSPALQVQVPAFHREVPLPPPPVPMASQPADSPAPCSARRRRSAAAPAANIPQDSAFHPIHLSIFYSAAMPTHAKYKTSTGSGHGRSRTPHMDTLEQAFKGDLNAISKHICICLLYQYHAEIQAGPTDPRFKAAKEAQEIRITAPPPLAVMRSIDLKNHAVSLSADRVVPQVFCFYCTEFFILHTMAET